MSTANPTFSQADRDLIVLGALIANGTALSEVVNLKDNGLIGIAIPGAWTNASITATISYDGETWFEVFKEDGSEYVITVYAPSTFIIIPPADFPGVRYIQFRSGTAASPVNQGQDTLLTIVAREI